MRASAETTSKRCSISRRAWTPSLRLRGRRSTRALCWRRSTRGAELGAVHRPAGPHAVALPREYRDRRVPHLRDRRFDGRRRHMGALTACPQKIAAAMPVCGYAAPFAVRAARHVPVWAFHAADDPVVPVTGEYSFAARRRRRRHAHGGFEPALRRQPRCALHRIPAGCMEKDWGVHRMLLGQRPTATGGHSRGCSRVAPRPL